MQMKKRLAPGGWLFVFAGLLPVLLGTGSYSASADTHAPEFARPSLVLDVPTTPRQGYRAARGCRGLPGSEATENCRMLA
jgi:hypothetical protein